MGKFDLRKMPKAVGITSKALLLASTFVFGVSLAAGKLMMENYDAVNAFLGFETSKVIPDPDAQNKDNFYFKSAFGSVREVRHNGEVYNESIVKEGVTLLKNNDALPLKKNAKVSLFSASSVSAMISSQTSTEKFAVTLKEGLEKENIQCNPELNKWYEDNLSTYGRKTVGSHVGSFLMINDASWDQITTPAKTNAEYGDAAIFVLTRGGGEGRDVTIIDGGNPNIIADTVDGNYLKLSPKERSVLENLKIQKDNGVFKKIIVLLNSANQVECEFIDDPSLGIDGFMWVGTYGQYGARAIGKIMSGKVNPSGKLPDTFWKYHYKNPVLANFGPLVNQDNSFGQGVPGWEGVNGTDHGSVVYQEGVYMGYRYTETRYEDTVLKTQNVGEFDYNDVVSYPFGYGLSYTTFDYSDFKVSVLPASSEENAPKELKEKRYVCEVTVKNTGTVDGKESVQIYAQKPYTEYDKEHLIEKPAVELVGFEKTKILKPGESQTLKITVGESRLTSYDSHGAKTYILENGTHYLVAGKNSHDAVNNILAAKGKTQKDGMVGIKKDDKLGDAKLVHQINIAEMDKTTYSKSLSTGKEIKNQFDNADLKLYEAAGEINHNSFKYFTRSDWEGTVKFGLTADNKRTNQYAIVKITQEMINDYNRQRDPKDAGKGTDPYPTYGADNGLQLIDLRVDIHGNKIPYNDPKWGLLLDQLTQDEQIDFLKSGFRKTKAIARIGKPETIDQNGGTGVIVEYNILEGINRGLAVYKQDKDRSKRPVIYACNGIVAATFNKSLADYYGRQWGEDMLWAGLQGLYGMGVNTHRSPFGGRNYHYYSEDGVLTGTMAGQVTKGIATRGAYVYLKHAFLNDQETYRHGVRTWINEQAAREIYLKPWQIAIEDGGASCVMTGMNSIGMFYSGGQGFCNNVLRDEFGMTGHVVTDTYGAYKGSYTRSIFYGNDLPDGTRNDNWESLNFIKDGTYSGMAWAIRESCHRILYNTVHSHAMNGITTGTKVITLTPPWVPAMQATKITSGVICGLSGVVSIALVGIEMFFEIKDKYANFKGGRHHE